MNAGIIVYRAGEDGLSGQWTHASLTGVVATEQVPGATLDAPVGTWPVTIATPEPAPLFEGTLTIAPLGASLILCWQGEIFLPARRAAIFDGIGMLLPREQVLIASFEERDPPTA